MGPSAVAPGRSLRWEKASPHTCEAGGLAPSCPRPGAAGEVRPGGSCPLGTGSAQAQVAPRWGVIRWELKRSTGSSWPGLKSRQVPVPSQGSGGHFACWASVGPQDKILFGLETPDTGISESSGSMHKRRGDRKVEGRIDSHAWFPGPLAKSLCRVAHCPALLVPPRAELREGKYLS